MKFILICLLAVIFSCSESNSNTNNKTFGIKQNPLKSFVEMDSIVPGNTPVYIDFTYTYEIGASMRFLKNGEISEIGIQMPDSGMYRFTIWSLSDTSVVLTDSILVDSGEVKYKQIQSIRVLTNDEIRLTIRTNDFYLYNHISGSDKSIFPQIVDDIELIDFAHFVYNNTTFDLKYPNYSYQNISVGYIDISFNPLE